MLKKTLITASAILYSSACFAQNINAEINLKVNEMNKDMTQAVDTMSETFKQVVPQMTQAMGNAMAIMFNSISSTLLAIEENKKLPKASPEMIIAMKETLDPKYTKDYDFNINKDINETAIFADYQEDNTVLKYKLSRNLGITLIIENILKDNSNYSQSSILDLNEDSRPTKDFENYNFDGKKFIRYSNNEKQETFVLGNIGAYLSVQIQTEGKNHIKMSEDFIKQLKYEDLKKAVKDDGKSIKEISSNIAAMSNDPAVLNRVMSTSPLGEN